MRSLLALLISLVALSAHAAAASQPAAPTDPDTFHDTLQGLAPYTRVIVLADPAKEAMVAVAPAMQGRVLTSTAAGPGGRSFGWVNQALIATQKLQKHFNAFGGEDRIWLGPEGGQFGLYFAPGDPFDLAHWYTPAPIDTEPFEVVAQTATSVDLRKAFTLRNYNGTSFSVRIDRTVRLLTTGTVWQDLKVAPAPRVHVVGFETRNRLTNTGNAAWKSDTGLLSIWILGQFRASSVSTIILPINPGSVAALGKPVTADYFGMVPPDRLHVTDNAVFFKADANARGKIGLSQKRARGILGSFDADHNVLTLIQYDAPSTPTPYVNSAWKLQPDPYSGDILNSYNDGPPAPGVPQLGRFYEMESSSPAEALAPAQSAEHLQRTIHIQGPREQLDKLAQATLGVSLSQPPAATPATRP